MRLPVHLPNEQNVIICDNSTEEQLIESIEQATMFIDYFELNKNNPQARKYLYSDIPSHYTFKKEKFDNKNVMHWSPRKNCFNTIGRMYPVSPNQTELFNFRILLFNIKGATSVDDLKIIKGEIHPTFTVACLALGLIEDDNEWKHFMTEATSWMMPQQLRLLFVRILIHYQPVHPKNLWNDFKNLFYIFIFCFRCGLQFFSN